VTCQAHSLGALSPGDTGLMTCHQGPRATEVPLPAGRMTSGIVRRGDRLLRPMGPWSPAVHEYLRHLEAAGFEGAPRVLGIEGDREVLTFIDGDVAADPQWQPGHGNRLPPYARTGLALQGAAELIRKLHQAAGGFRPSITSYRFHPYPPKAGERSWPRSRAARSTNPNRCAGSRASRQTSLAHSDDGRHASEGAKGPPPDCRRIVIRLTHMKRSVKLLLVI
jgi:hypothetical protein